MAEQRETAAKSAALKPQNHGGALLSAGKKGNRGGGRKPNAAKALALEHYTKRIPLLGKIADNEEIDAQQRINAIVELRKGAGIIEENGSVSQTNVFAKIEHKIYLPPLGVEVQSLNGEHAE